MFSQKTLIQTHRGHQPGVAVRRSTGALVSPAPIGVDHDAGRLSGAGGPWEK
jgi:hypothetical protein